jgi:hypothetical protein
VARDHGTRSRRRVGLEHHDRVIALAGRADAGSQVEAAVMPEREAAGEGHVPFVHQKPCIAVKRRAGLSESAPGEIRTPDLRFRRPTLYPAELRAHCAAKAVSCRPIRLPERLSDRGLTGLTGRIGADGGGGIRTRGPLARTPVFKTGAFDHSATPPRGRSYREAASL